LLASKNTFNLLNALVSDFEHEDVAMMGFEQIVSSMAHVVFNSYHPSQQVWYCGPPATTYGSEPET
jgi:hypothetical protein